MRVALFTNNYLPFRGGVTTSVETLRRGVDALHHDAWVFAPVSQSLYRTARALDPDVVHAQHPFLLGPTARRLARRHRRPLVFNYHTRYEKYAHYVPLPER